MEHIVQFAVGIDDDAIVKRVTDYAEKQINKDLLEKIERNVELEIFVYNKNWYGEDRKNGLQEWVKNRVYRILDDNQDKIVELAAEKLADKMSRTKAIKEALVNKVSEG